MHEDLLELYNTVEFDRIKLLQVRINNNCNESAKEYEISETEYDQYCQKYKNKPNMIFELENEMESSYIIIDSYGYLISNKDGFHEKTGRIFDHDLSELINKADIRYEKFIKRYKHENEVNG